MDDHGSVAFDGAARNGTVASVEGDRVTELQAIEEQTAILVAPAKAALETWDPDASSPDGLEKLGHAERLRFLRHAAH